MIFEHPPYEVEQALKRLRIECRNDGQEGAFTAEVCPACDDGSLHMQWMGEERFTVRCHGVGGCDEPAIGKAIGVDLPWQARPAIDAVGTASSSTRYAPS